MRYCFNNSVPGTSEGRKFNENSNVEEQEIISVSGPSVNGCDGHTAFEKILSFDAKRKEFRHDFLLPDVTLRLADETHEYDKYSSSSESSYSSNSSGSFSISDKDKSVMENKEDLTGFNVLFGVTQVVGGILCVLVLIWSIVHRGGFAWSANPGLQFNWHPLLMTIGMVYLFANSIMIYRALRNMHKKKLKLLHAGIHTAIVLLIIIAQTAVIQFHNAKSIPNFYSLHSWVGIVCMLIFVLQWVFGLVAFLYPGLSPPLRAAILPLHVYFGLTAFVLAITASISGLLEKAIFVLGKKYGELPGEAVLINIIGLLFIVFGMLVVHIIAHTGYKRYNRN